MARRITKEFLEEALGEEIDEFQVTSSATKISDSYSSNLYSIAIHFKPPKPRSKLIASATTITITGSENTTPTKKNRNDSNDELPPSSPGQSQFVGKLKSQHFILKCYPCQPERQVFLSDGNLFRKEVSVYNTIIPELIRFQRKNSNIVTFEDTKANTYRQKQTFYKPPFPEFFFGRAVNYDALGEGESKICTDPLENCVILTDLRKNGHGNGGFKLLNQDQNRLEGFDLDLDLDHAKLVISAQAKLHALSWAYKLVTNTQSLGNKFDFLDTSIFDRRPLTDKILETTNKQHINLFREAVQDSTDINEDKKHDFLECLDRFWILNRDVNAMYFSQNPPPGDYALNKDNILRVPQPHNENEHPWSVLIHGDASLDNMLFSYDDTTGKPLEVIFVDLQMTREGDPFCDLVHTLYTSTSVQFRKQHLTHLLKLYVVTFIQVCENFRVVPLPGFQLSEVQRRFHRAKAFGLAMAIKQGLPIFLNNEQKNALDIDTKTEDSCGCDDPNVFIEQFRDMGKAAKVNKEKSTFGKTVVELLTELNAEGVI